MNPEEGEQAQNPEERQWTEEEIAEYYRQQAEAEALQQPQPQAPVPPAQPEAPAAGAGVYDDLSAPPPAAPASPPPQAVPPAQSAPPPATTPPQEAAPESPAGRGRGRAPRKMATGSRRGTTRRPATTVRGGNRPGYQGGRPGRYVAPQKSGVSVFSVFLGLIGVAMIVVVGLLLMPQDLSYIQGYPASAVAAGSSPRNLLAEGQAIINNPEVDELAFTEEEINVYLNQRIQGKQGGLLGALIQYKGCYVDFSPNLAEFYIERSLLGIPLTMSSKLRIRRFRDQVQWVTAGGKIGKFSMGQKQQKPVVEAFRRLLKLCEDEALVVEQMVDIRFEEDRVVLDSSY